VSRLVCFLASGSSLGDLLDPTLGVRDLQAKTGFVAGPQRRESAASFTLGHSHGVHVWESPKHIKTRSHGEFAHHPVAVTSGHSFLAELAGT